MGFLFLLPTLRQSHFSRGLLLSLVPTLIQLFIVFPIQNQKGVLGIELGAITPLFVLLYNAIWGDLYLILVEMGPGGSNPRLDFILKILWTFGPTPGTVLDDDP